MRQVDPTLPISRQPEQVRSAFLFGTYARLTAAVGLFVAFEWYLFSSGAAAAVLETVMATSWLLVLAGFMLVSWLATRLSATALSPAGRWAGLVLLVAANAVIFVPMLATAEAAVPGTVALAAQYSVAGFLLLTLVAARSSRDFRWLGPLLRWVGLLSLAGVVISLLTGFQLGVWFSLAMIALAGASILHDTQEVLHSSRPGDETLAAMRLFGSLSLLFWYVLRLLAASRR